MGGVSATAGYDGRGWAEEEKRTMRDAGALWARTSESETRSTCGSPTNQQLALHGRLMRTDFVNRGVDSHYHCDVDIVLAGPV